MLEILIICLVLLWITGNLVSIGGGFVHLLLVCALVILVVRIASRKRVE